VPTITWLAHRGVVCRRRSREAAGRASRTLSCGSRSKRKSRDGARRSNPGTEQQHAAPQFMSEISVRLPDGHMLKVPQGSTVLGVATVLGRSAGPIRRRAHVCAVNQRPRSPVVGEKRAGAGCLTPRRRENQKLNSAVMALGRLVGQWVENTNARRMGPVS